MTGRELFLRIQTSGKDWWYPSFVLAGDDMDEGTDSELFLKILALAWDFRITKESGHFKFFVNWKNGETKGTVNLREMSASLATQAHENQKLFSGHPGKVGGRGGGAGVGVGYGQC